jgi:hypothetical protein
LISGPYWRHYVSSSLIISEQTLFGNPTLKSEHTPARRCFHLSVKTLGNICAETCFMRWPSHKIRLLFCLSNCSSWTTLAIRQ